VKSITTFHYPLVDARQLIRIPAKLRTRLWTIAVCLGRCCSTAGWAGTKIFGQCTSLVVFSYGGSRGVIAIIVTRSKIHAFAGGLP